jgi:hypothetical protein
MCNGGLHSVDGFIHNPVWPYGTFVCHKKQQISCLTVSKEELYSTEVKSLNALTNMRHEIYSR